MSFTAYDFEPQQQGKKFKKSFYYTTWKNVVIPFDTSDGRMYVREDFDDDLPTLLDISTSGASGANSVIGLTITASAGSIAIDVDGADFTLDPGNYAYNLYVIDADDEEIPFLRGLLPVVEGFDE